MEKILGYDLNNIVRGNTMEDLTYIDRTNKSDRVYLRNIYIAEEDGVVLYDDNKTEYLKGDLLISFEYYKPSTPEAPFNDIHRVVNTRTTNIAQVIMELVGNETI